MSINRYEPCSLPEEVLEMIFSHVGNPQDLGNVSRACPQFQRILGANKVTWLFNEVLPFIYEDLEKDDVFALRLVCKMWKESLTNFLDNRYTCRPYDPVLDKDLTPISRQYVKKHWNFRRDMDKPRIGALTLGHNINEVGQSPGEWLNKLGNYPGNPFILKYVKIYTGNYGPIHASPSYFLYWDNIFIGLSRYGQHIQHLKLIFQEGHSDFLAFYKKLRRILQLTPNLRRLTLATLFNLPDPPVRNYEKLRSYIASHPLRPLTNLHSLYCTVDGESFSSNQQQILEEVFRRYQPQIRKLKIDPDILCRVDGSRVDNYVEMCENLTELHLRVHSKSGKDSKLVDFLRTAPPFPNLGKLTITFRFQATGYTIQEFMDPLQKFGSLKILNLDFRRNPEMEEMSKIRSRPLVRLLSVKVMDMYLGWYYSDNCYDAILAYVPCLEYLHINHWNHVHWMEGRDDADKGQGGNKLFEVMKGLHSGWMYGSNIWNRLGNLKAIGVGSLSMGERDSEEEYMRDERLHVFTRENYKVLLKNGALRDPWFLGF